MIAIASETGSLIKVVPLPNAQESEKEIGFHSKFGFVSEDNFEQRARNWERHGFKRPEEAFDFQFKIKKDAARFMVVPIDGCEVKQEAGDSWTVNTNGRSFKICPVDAIKGPIVPEKEEEDGKKVLFIPFLIGSIIPVLLIFMPRTPVEVKPEVIEQVTVQVQPETVKPVAIKDAFENLPKEIKPAQQLKRAIKQDLGFLGLLGRKDLTKAIGGTPTKLKDASPGAGPGGTEGSGGELLVGLGQGLKRTTVGNSGTVGLGGIGTKGKGGGQGGYGNSEVGSGEGVALSQLPLAQEIVLEGGLDRSVIQATIAKYLSQVRACYEGGLKRNPGLAGLVTMNFEIGKAGGLNFAKVGKTTLGDEQVEQCISERMMNWKFPAPRGGVDVKVTYPFLLRSARS
jgi:hypothetical protein